MARSGLPNAGREKRLQTGAAVPVSSYATAPYRCVLNDRETELLACLDMGLLYKEIEARLHLSHAALRKRQHRLYVKLGAQNRTEALNRWREKRLEETNETSTLSTRKARACVEMPAAGAPRQTLNHASFLHANLLA